MVKDTPIRFTPENLLLVDREDKQQTRRLEGLDAINLDPNAWSFSRHTNDQWVFQYDNPRPGESDLLSLTCPYGIVGNGLWIQEAVRFGANWDTVHASTIPPGVDLTYERDAETGFWGPRRSSHSMPQWACRLWLVITNIRMQRLQEISAMDCLAEGIKSNYHTHPQIVKERFQSLWESIHGPGSWERNDWVWALTFQKAKR